MQIEIDSNTDYTSRVFSESNAKRCTVQQSVFVDCRFVDCDLSGAGFTDRRFGDCEFENSDCNSVNCDRSKFIGATFRHCKVAGVNWTTLGWSSYRQGRPLLFEWCDISFSVFSSLVLRELCLRDSKARGLDFSECDLEGAECCRTDFQDSRFSACHLEQCNFLGATSYLVDRFGNSIEKARFNSPEVLSLFSSFNIEIDEIE